MTLGNDSDLSTCFAWAKSHRCTFMSTIKVSNVSMSVPPIAFRLFNLIYHQNSHTLITVIQFRMTDWANDASQGIEINRSANDLIQVKAENWFTKVGFHKTLTISSVNESKYSILHIKNIWIHTLRVRFTGHQVEKLYFTKLTGWLVLLCRGKECVSLYVWWTGELSRVTLWSAQTPCEPLKELNGDEWRTNWHSS